MNPNPVIPYGRQSIDESDIDAVAQVLRGDWLTTGPAVTRFEADLCEAGGARFAVSVTSGTAALHTAYAALGLGPGDEVVMSPLTFVATASAAVLLGARIVFADVDRDTGCLDPAAAAAAITPRTRAIATIDYAGTTGRLDELRRISADQGVALLEDAAHSIGARWRGQPVGSVADVTTFSFFPTKNMTTAEGGAVLTNDPAIAERAVRFHNHGLVRDAASMVRPNEGAWHQEVQSFGLNYRLPDVLAALGSSQLKRVPSFAARRAHIHARYNSAFAGIPGVATPVATPGCEPAWHLYPLRVPPALRRDVFEQLRLEGIGVQVNYEPVYWHPVFEALGYERGTCPNAEEYYQREISLPLFPELTDEQCDRVITATLRALQV